MNNLKPSSIFLDAVLKKSLLGDVEKFIGSQAWYNSCGIPYKRGYLFYGPPGCGKTSTILAIAGQFNMNIGIINLAEPGLGDERLFYLLSIAPRHTMIVLEDIDRAFSAAESATHTDPRYKGMNSLTLSGLLNALDGIASTNGLMIFMTTNNFGK